MKRTLTAAEMRHERIVCLAEEQRTFPDHMIEVMVLPETDDEGRPVLHIIKRREIIL
ncbi:hypothetical protein [Rhizobium ruizarguesonis]